MPAITLEEEELHLLPGTSGGPTLRFCVDYWRDGTWAVSHIWLADDQPGWLDTYRRGVMVPDGSLFDALEAALNRDKASERIQSAVNAALDEDREAA